MSKLFLSDYLLTLNTLIAQLSHMSFDYILMHTRLSNVNRYHLIINENRLRKSREIMHKLMIYNRQYLMLKMKAIFQIHRPTEKYFWNWNMFAGFNGNIIDCFIFTHQQNYFWNKTIAIYQIHLPNWSIFNQFDPELPNSSQNWFWLYLVPAISF